MSNLFLEKIINEKEAERFVSPFQPLPLREKIEQFFLTSSNIVFGNKLEEAMKEVLKKNGVCFSLPRKMEDYDFDQLFIYKNKIFLIEQKVRDDHDSSKKRGQVQNFLEKEKYLKERFPTNDLISCMWFIDPSFRKNKNYYYNELGKKVVYGEEVFFFLGNVMDISPANCWTSFLENMEEKKKEISKIDEKLFSCPINVRNVSLNKLYDYIKIGNKKEIKSIFFTNLDFSKEILEECSRKKKTSKISLLEDIIKNGYFK